MRVQVKIPGGVTTWAVDSKGEKVEMESPDTWDETWVSAVLRSLNDDSFENGKTSS
jgi:hypothetical protein